MLLGTIRGEPKLKIRDGLPRLTFCLLTSETIQKQGKGYLHEEYHDLLLEGNAAQSLHPLLHDGAGLFAEGSIKTEVITDRTGVRRYHTYIRVHHLEQMQIADPRL